MPERLATLRVGDGISAPGAWGRAVRFGGVQFGTNFATQPTLVTTPLLAARGEAVVPSTVDVFINGQRVASEAVPPGPFAIENLPGDHRRGRAPGRRHRCARPTAGPHPALLLGIHAASRRAERILVRARRDPRGLRAREFRLWRSACRRRRSAAASRTRSPPRCTPRRRSTARVRWARHRLAGRDAGRRHRRPQRRAATSEDSGWLAGLGVERSGRRMHVFARTQLASERLRADRPLRARAAAEAAQLRRRRHRPRALRQPSSSPTGTRATGTSSQRRDAGRQLLADTGRLRLRQPVRESHPVAGSSQTDVYLGWTMPLGNRRSVGSSLSYRPDSPPATASRRRPRCSRTCRPARARATT